MSDEHERMSELLPWYVNATLDAREAAQVERHLASCADCREESERFRAIARGQEEGWAPSPAHFARITARIDAPSFWQRLASSFRHTPLTVRWAFGLQGAALAALVAVVALRPQVFETLSRPPAAASSRARLHVVFASDLTEEGMRRLLQGAHATIVDGPSAEGVYTLELSLPAADRERAKEIADRLGKDPKVRFAAPVASSSP
ncbi:MAG TPA: zf-HC2 domain-containing protein [Myxococcales bacterium]|nr:zf-HC2 domain-containing protein [Myxococcales bacterium]